MAKIVDGIQYQDNTPQAVITALRTARRNKTHVHIHLGDAVTGQDWHEEHDVHGYVGRSTGSIKIPLLMPTLRSPGGAEIATHAVVKIVNMNTGEVLYQHPTYRASLYTIEFENTFPATPYATFRDGELDARHKSVREAKDYIQKVGGAYFD